MILWFAFPWDMVGTQQHPRTIQWETTLVSTFESLTHGLRLVGPFNIENHLQKVMARKCGVHTVQSDLGMAQVAVTFNHIVWGISHPGPRNLKMFSKQ